MDLIVRSGTVVDGTGSPGIPAASRSTTVGSWRSTLDQRVARRHVAQPDILVGASGAVRTSDCSRRSALPGRLLAEGCDGASCCRWRKQCASSPTGRRHFGLRGATASPRAGMAISSCSTPPQWVPGVTTRSTFPRRRAAVLRCRRHRNVVVNGQILVEGRSPTGCRARAARRATTCHAPPAFEPRATSDEDRGVRDPAVIGATFRHRRHHV